MESFFQAALNSVLEVAGGGSRSRNSNSSSSNSSVPSATPSRSSTGVRPPTHSSSSSWRPNRYSSTPSPERVASSHAPSRVSATVEASTHGAPQSAASSTRGAERGLNGTDSARDCTSPPEKASISTESSAQSALDRSSTTASSEGCGKETTASGNAWSTAPVRDRKAADRLKDLGNESFRRGMYGLAAEYYSKAIAADETVPSYFTNRALCHKRENRYAEALQDAESALALEESNVKGLYIKGDALVQLGGSQIFRFRVVAGFSGGQSGQGMLHRFMASTCPVGCHQPTCFS